MKGLFRRPGVQAVLGWLLAAYLQLILKTVRWRHVDDACLEPFLTDRTGLLALMWHGRIPLSLATAPKWWPRGKTQVLVSPSSDGEFVAQALDRVGFPSIRMSSAKKGDSAKARAAVAGFRQALGFVGDGGALIISPDGPRGPNEVVAPGAVQIAKRTQAPVFLMGLAAAPSLRLDSWDKVMLAAPFGRGAVVWDGPFYAPADAQDHQIAELCADWSARLSAATRRAEALVGAAPLPATAADET